MFWSKREKKQNENNNQNDNNNQNEKKRTRQRLEERDKRFVEITTKYFTEAKESLLRCAEENSKLIDEEDDEEVKDILMNNCNVIFEFVENFDFIIEKTNEAYKIQKIFDKIRKIIRLGDDDDA